jgi:colanic acid/amylovoran biosynthesis protein
VNSSPLTPGNSSRPRVCLFGASLDVGNRGVRALGVSLAGLITRTWPGVEIAYHYFNATGGSRMVSVNGSDLEVTVRNCRLSPRSALAENILVILCLALLHRIGIRQPARRNRWLGSLLDAEFVGEIRGGDSFSDIYGFRRFFFGCLPLLSVAILDRPYAMLPQTYGPFRRRTSRWLASVLLRRAAAILTRDEFSEPTVLELCGRRPSFCPDVAFTLEARKPDHVTFLSERLELGGQDFIVGVNVSGLLYMGGYTRENMFGLRDEYHDLVDHLLEHVLSSTSAKILLVPHVFGSEQEEDACASILHSLGTRYPGRVFALAGPLSECEVKWLIGRTDFFIGSRMHACIAALSQCVPAVGLAYSDKFLGVFQSVGVGESVIDLRKADLSEVVARTLSAAERRLELKDRLQSRIPVIQHQIARVFRDLLPVAATPERSRA